MKTVRRYQRLLTARGFTMVELMVCVVIIGVLSSIAVQKYSRHKTKILVKGEVFSALSPWIRDCRAGVSCRRCRGLSHHFKFEPARGPAQCRVTAKRAHPNIDAGDFVVVEINDDGAIQYRGPLATFLR